MAERDLEKEYSPSRWSKRFSSAQEVLQHHITFAGEESNKSRQRYNYRLDVPYGEGARQKFDLYYLGKEEGSAIFVYIHGGCWQELDKENSAYCVAPIVENGHRVIVLDYDLCPQVTLEELTKEVKGAAEVIFKYAEDTSARSISFCGHSAGAHLIACLLEEFAILRTSLVKSVFLISGLYDLTELWRTTAMNANDILTLNADKAKELSPLYWDFKHLSGTDLRIHVIAAENDSPAFLNQSNKFNLHLEKVGVRSTFKIIANCDHFDIVENLSSKDFDISQIILKELNNST